MDRENSSENGIILGDNYSVKRQDDVWRITFTIFIDYFTTIYKFIDLKIYVHTQIRRKLSKNVSMIKKTTALNIMSITIAVHIFYYICTYVVFGMKHILYNKLQ